MLQSSTHGPVTLFHGIRLLVHGEWWYFGGGTTLFQLCISSETWSRYLKSATLLNPSNRIYVVPVKLYDR